MTGKIVIEIEKNDFAESLLTAIQRYYPIGADFQSRESYSGYRQLLKLMDSYSDHTIENEVNKTFDSLKIALENSIATSYPISYNRGSIFPNRSFDITIHQSQVEDRNMATVLKCRISLLHKSWTLFFEDMVGTMRYGQPFLSKVISTKNMMLDENGDLFTKVKEIISTSYPDHLYIEPRFLLTEKVGKGIPYGIDEIIEYYGYYTIYDYLFHKEYHYLSLPSGALAMPVIVFS